MADSRTMADCRKIPLSARVPPAVAAELDRIAETIRPRPTRSQIVAIALEDWIKTRPDERKPHRVRSR